MKIILRRIVVFLGILLAFAVLAIGPELLGDDAKDGVTKLVGEDYFLPVVIGAVVVALLISVFWTEGDKIFKRSKKASIEGEVEDSLFQEARDGQRVAFEDRSSKKLAGRDFIDLEVSYTVEGSHDLAPLLNKGVKEGEKEQDLLKVFEGASGRLLMIGLPGSGKTTLLLQLAIALLDKYEEQIPVVLDIATWQSRFTTIEEWAVELLPDMGFNKSLAQELINDKKLLPLFDGLDELGEDSRAGFLAAVEKYAAESANRFVITSRKAEYAATIDAAVEYQVVVNPFTLFQIREALHKKSSPERTAILDRIDNDEHFAEAIKTPFYLNAVQLLFSHKNLSQQLVFEADDLKGRQREIETSFVEHAMGGLENYSKDDVRRWLAFLADRMSKRRMVRFELVDMQHDWGLLSGSQLLVPFLLRNGGLEAFLSLLMSVFFFYAMNVALGAFSGFVFSVTAFVFLISISNVNINDAKDFFSQRDVGLAKIRTRENVNWSFIEILKSIRRYVFISALISPMFIIAIILAIYVALYVVGGREALDFSLGAVLYIFIFILIFGFVIGVVKGIWRQLIMAKSYLVIKRPYKRFLASMWTLNISILQHWYLCYLLRKKGLLPKQYPGFLKASTDQNILESDGGSWRFRHRILQEYFVGVWEAEYGGDEALKDGLQ